MVNYRQIYGRLALFVALGAQVQQCSATIAKFLPQSFLFDWNSDTQPVPIPTTAQCETIHIKWARGGATGPSYVAPLFLQVYTSTSLTPFIIPAGSGTNFDWQVPFAPGTQYQICMFDKVGNTGGCQAVYTVTNPTSNPTCSNATQPTLLAVEAKDTLGTLSQYGWPEQCSDIQVTPKGGTPPYTLTVAPALHPPYNLTSNDGSPLNWTISLTWASPFFISMVDATGAVWANGPLHVGASPTSPTACLVGNATAPLVVKDVGQGVAIGSGIGGLAVGIGLGLLAMWLLLRRRAKKRENEARFATDTGPGSPQPLMYESSQYRAIPTQSSNGVLTPSNPSSTMMHRMGSSNYQVEPFHMPDEDGRLYGHAGPTSPGSVYAPSVTGNRVSTVGHETNTNLGHRPSAGVVNTGGSSHNTQQRPNTATSSSGGGGAGPSQVYVVHHDAQAAPVTIYHQEGTQIVELPPRYAAGQSDVASDHDPSRTGSDSRSDASRRETNPSLVLHQPRQPGGVLKPQRGPGSPP